MDDGQHRKLDRPEKVGDISVAEAAEIKALNKLIGQLSEDAQKAQYLLQLAQSQRSNFLAQLVTGRGLSLSDLYSVNDDSGQILRTHEHLTESVIEETPTG
jgi:hypothetical protein